MLKTIKSKYNKKMILIIAIFSVDKIILYFNFHLNLYFSNQLNNSNNYYYLYL